MGSGSVLDGEFVQGGRILYAKLIGTLASSAWLVWIGGWITVQRAIVDGHIQLLNAAQRLVSALITAVLGGGAFTIRRTWGEAFQAAVEISPVLAPLLLAGEIVIVLGILYWARDVFGGG